MKLSFISLSFLLLHDIWHTQARLSALGEFCLYRTWPLHQGTSFQVWSSPRPQIPLALGTGITVLWDYKWIWSKRSIFTPSVTPLSKSGPTTYEIYFVIFWHAELLLLVVAVLLPNFKFCVWHNSAFLFMYLCSYVSPGSYVSNPLAIFNSKSTIRIYDKFIQGLTEINTETLHSLPERCFKVLERSTQNKLHN